MTCKEAFKVSHDLMRKGIMHKIGKQFGQWNVVVIGDKK